MALPVKVVASGKVQVMVAKVASDKTAVKSTVSPLQIALEEMLAVVKAGQAAAQL